MIDDPKAGPPAEPTPKGPAPWERKRSDDLKQELEGGQEAYELGAKEGEASHLAAEGQSLTSKLRGGGMDQAKEGPAAFSGTKLCPACTTVTTFAQGVCTNCQYRLGTDVPQAPDAPVAPTLNLQGGGGYIAEDDAPAFSYAPERSSSGKPMLVVLLIVIAVAVIGGGGWWFLKGRGEDKPAETTAGSLEIVESFPGTLAEVLINETFHDDLAAALEDGNKAWADAGVEAYVYRYSTFSKVTTDTSQSIAITAFVGGKDTETALINNLALFDTAVQPFLADLRSRPGVAVMITPKEFAERDIPAADDVYLRYGYDYGLENFNRLKGIIDGLEEIKKATGQYPISISKSIARPPISTLGSYKFIADGFGYIPVYKTDSSGKIIFGEGGYRETNTPLEATGYYILWFGGSATSGIDFLSRDNYQYMEKNYWFPYEVTGPVRNIDPTPDGEPDGIMCVVKDGELLRL